MKTKKYLKIGTILLLCYAVFGFLIFPLALRYFGEKALKEHVSPDAVITKVKANPFTWQLQVEGLSLSDPAGQWSLDVGRATVNLSAKTLYKFYPVLDLVSLESPRISYLRSPQEESEEVLVEDKADAPASLEDVASLLNTIEIPEVFVVLLEVKNGAMNFRDVTNESAFEKSVDPINFRLENFTTEVDADEDNAMRFLAKTDTGTELEWTGELTSQPFASSGTVRVSGFEIDRFSPYFEKFIKFDLERAIYAMQFSYAINFGDLDQLFTVSDGSIDLTNVLCVGRDDAGEFFVLDSVGISGFGFDYNSLQISLEQVFVGGGVLGVRRDEAGTINLLDLLVLPETGTMATPEPVETGGDSFELPELPIGLTLDTFLIQDFRVEWVDSMIPGGADFELLLSEYSLKGLSSEFSEPVGLNVLVLIGEAGRLTASGELTPAVAGVELVLGVQGLDLSLANAYGLFLADTLVNSGIFEYSGGLSGDFESGYNVTGEGSVQDFALALSGVNTVDLEWASFNFSGLSAETKPLSVTMGAVVLTEPKAVVTRSASTEVAESVEVEATTDSDEPAEAEPPTETVPPEPVVAPLEVFIASFALDKGSMHFIDEAIQPTFRLDVEEAEVDVSNITLGKEQITEFSISALVNRSQFNLAGSAYPIDPRSQTSMTMSLRELALPVFSPYSGKAVGRKVGSGWFTIDTDLQVNSGDMEASNLIKIDQMELGDSVDSPDAINLPLSLAISLLKGSDGVMNLELPLTGDLYNPSIGVGQIIRTAVSGLIRSVAMSPFSMLSGLVGSDADLSKVEFAPGSTALSPKMTEILEALGSALQKRPELTLSLTPALSDEDLVVLANPQLEAPSEAGSVSVEESNGKLERSPKIFTNRKGASNFSAKASESPALIKEPGGNEEIELLPKVEPTDPLATDLMAARVQVVIENLLKVEGVTQGRLTVLDPDFSINRSIVGFDLE